MSLHDRLGLTKKKPKSTNEVTITLNKGELEALLIGMGEASFKGRQVESVYRLAVKLQTEFDKLK